MKQILIQITTFLIVAGMVLIACSFNRVGLANQDQAIDIVLKIAARRAAVKFLEKNPDEIDRVKSYANRILNEEINQIVLDEIANYLTGSIGDDPLLEQDLKDLSGLIVIDVSDPNFDPDLIKVVAQGFVEGVMILK